MSRRFHQGRIRQVSLEDFGGDSTGTDPSDDALALALETELPVSIPPGTWLFNATHPLLADGQTVLGVGSQTIIKPSGNFNFLTISGGLIGCEIGDFHYDGALQSGGYIVYASNHGRTIIRNIKSTSPFDGFYSEQVNQLTFKDLWLQGFRGTMMFNLFGSPSEAPAPTAVVGPPMSMPPVPLGRSRRLMSVSEPVAATMGAVPVGSPMAVT